MKYWVCILVTGLSVFLRAEEDWVSLTSTEGKTIEARIIATTEQEVEIELKNGSRFTLPHSRFSLTSREVIRKAHEKPKGPRLGRVQNEPDAPQVSPPFEFKGFSFRESESQHFRFMTLGTSAREVRGIAEKVFVLMMPRLQGLRDKFEQGEFRAPGEAQNPGDFQQGDGVFKYTVHLVAKQQDYVAMVEQYAASIESRKLKEFVMGTAPNLGQFTDFKNRFSVAYDDGKTDLEGLVAHQVGFQLVSIETESQHLPLWLRMGAGYFAEHKVQSRCTVFYADFTAYGENQYGEGGAGGGVVEKREVLSAEQSWVPSIKAMSRREMPVGLARMLEVSTGDLTPVESAFALALFSYCTSGVQEMNAFREVLDLVSKQEDPNAEAFAKLFGFETVEAFDAAWRDYIQSRKFR